MKLYLAAAALLFAATPALADSWRLCSVSEAGREETRSQYQMTFNLEGTGVHGKAGCNNYSAELTNGGDQVFTEIRSTIMACLREDGSYHQELMDAEAQFLGILSRANTMVSNETALSISTNDGSELRFAREGACQ